MVFTYSKDELEGALVSSNKKLHIRYNIPKCNIITYDYESSDDECKEDKSDYAIGKYVTSKGKVGEEDYSSSDESTEKSSDEESTESDTE